MIDFSKCPIDQRTTYGGSDQKRGIYYQGKRYMLKMSDRIPEAKRNSLNSSYTNSAFSEHIGCEILKSIGFPVQKTLIGYITIELAGKVDKGHPVVACENFVPEGCELVEFKTIESILMTKKPPKVPAMEDIYNIMAGGNPFFTREFGREAMKAYWDLFIADALLGNFDRHANNWGYLIDKDNNISLAPVYDCGSCLYPQLADDALKGILDSEEEIMMRIEKFPNAALTDYEGNKVSYMQYIASFQNTDCTSALLRIFPKIDMDKIDRIIDETEELSDIRRTFYKTMLHKRYELILQRPYLQIMDRVNAREEDEPER